MAAKTPKVKKPAYKTPLAGAAKKSAAVKKLVSIVRGTNKPDNL